jgi:hypothetical protein
MFGNGGLLFDDRKGWSNVVRSRSRSSKLLLALVSIILVTSLAGLMTVFYCLMTLGVVQL